MLNLATILDDAARKSPDRTALVFGGVRLTYRELHQASGRVANALWARGVGPGDKVALSCPNTPQFAIAYYGILKTGAVVVPLNILLKGQEVAYHLRDSDARLYLCFEGIADVPIGRQGYEGFRAAGCCQEMVVMTAAGTSDSPIPDLPTLSALTAGQSPVFETVLRPADDTAVILYTSGTTGKPKGAELTHVNMVLNAFVARDLWFALLDQTTAPVTLVALPLFHSFGQTCQLNAGMLTSGTLVLVPRFDPGTVLDLLIRERVSYFAGVPTMYWGLLNHAQQQGVDGTAVGGHLRVCLSGGAPMPLELLRAFEAAFGVTILEGYGLSETSPVATFNHPRHPRKPGSVGIPVIGVDVRLVNEQGDSVPRGSPGEIVIRGHNIMKCYYKRPDATVAAMRDGWFHTGDVAVEDEDGYLFIVDRLKDMIIRGGFNVYPRELEEVLMTHPAVSLAAVVGVPHEEHGEEVKAYIVRKPGAQVTEQEIVDWCAERMAAYKYPRLVEFRAQLPMTATGKILKRELRNAAPAPRAAGHRDNLLS